MRRPISVQQAADMLKVSTVSIIKRVHAGTIVANSLSNKGWLVCAESALGLPFDRAEFDRMCGQYVSVPEACDIVCVTDGMVGRMLMDGRLAGFRLNGKAWAVSRRSCEENIRDYLSSGSHRGQPRRIGESRRPPKKQSACLRRPAG